MQQLGNEHTLTPSGDEGRRLAQGLLPLQPGAVVGRFVLLSELGAGGMGVVYLAYDPKLDRKIALKFLHERGSANASRLLREAQALARVAHPNVVAVHDVGALGDRVWLAMEHIEGLTMAEWLGREPRPWREVLELLRAAARGVVAAHAVGLVHRDLKPDNLMIGDDGRVRVMDFGLVRVDEPLAEASVTASDHPFAAADATATRTGALVGTPAYMAPEQFRGRTVGPRADQFSFCAVAWRALYGERPFAGESLAELRFAVIHGRRQPPPSRTKVPSWLRDALARGLAVDPDARWPSMAALLEALDSGRRRAGVRRIVVAALGVATLAGAGQLYQRWDRATEAAQRTATCVAEGREIDEVWNGEVREQLEAAFVASDSPFARDAWLRVDAAFGAHAERWTAARVRACVEAEVEQVRDSAAADSARACLDDHRITLSTFTDIFSHVDAGGVSQAVLVVAQLEPPEDCLDDRGLGQRDPLPADPEQQARARALRERLVRVHALLQTRADTLSNEAAAALREAQALDFAPLLAEAEFLVGWASLKSGDTDGAGESLERALFLAAEHGADRLAVDVASVLTYLAYERADYEVGLRWGRVGRMIVARQREGMDLVEAHLYQGIAGLHERRGAYDQSLEVYTRALEVYERQLPADHLSLASLFESICVVQSKRGEFEEALSMCDRARAIHARSLPRLHPNTGLVLLNTGVVHMDRGAPEQALPYFLESLEISLATLPAKHPDLGLSYNNIGVAYLDSGDPAKALPEFQRAEDLWTDVLRADHPLLAYPLTGKGRCLLALDRRAEALAPLERAFVLRTEQEGDANERAETEFALARALGPDARARALELGEAALAGMREGGQLDERIAEVEVWLAGARR